MSEVQILLLLLLSGYLISVSLGMVIIEILVISTRKDCMMSRILERYTRPRFPAWVACRFSRGLDVVCLGDRLSPLSVALGSV